MASGRSTISKASQPSAAFQVKCAKEKEKLRSRLQKQLQKHMLNALQDATFSDLRIEHVSEVSSPPSCDCETGVENKSPLVTTCHSGILNVRVPNFYQELLKSNASNREDTTATTIYLSPLEKDDLEKFLRKVYTDDDIRKHECDAIRLFKTINENRREQVVAPVASETALNVESPESNLVGQTLELNEKNLARHCCGETRNDNKIETNQISACLINEELPPPSNCSPLNSLDKAEYSPKGEESSDSLELNKKRIPNQLEIYNVYETEKINNTENMNAKQSAHAPAQSILSPALSELDKPDETPSPLSTSSLVRSSTFDLQCPLALEKVLDDEEPEVVDEPNQEEFEEEEEEEVTSDWNKKSSQVGVVNYKEMMLNTTREIQQCISGNAGSAVVHSSADCPVQSFYLHQRSSSQHVNEHNVPIMHCSTSDGSLSLADSGFLSQSLFSDTDVVTSSLPSSLVNSFEAGVPPPTTTTNTTQNNTADLNKMIENEVEYIEPPSPMFPMYFEVPVKNGAPIDSNGNVPPTKTTTYGTTPKTMDLIAELPPSAVHKSPQMNSSCDTIENGAAIKRPQSCYMFIDLDTVAKEEEELAAAKRKHQEQLSQNKRIQSLSMFIDFTKDNKDVVSQAQKQYKQFASNRSFSAVGPREIRKPSYDENPPPPPDLIRKNCHHHDVVAAVCNFSENLDQCNNVQVTTPEKKLTKGLVEDDSMDNISTILGPIGNTEESPSSTNKSRVKSAPITKSEKDKEKKNNFNDEPIKSSPRKEKSMKSGGIDEDGLLPMSPIMRRKVVKTEKPKVEPEKICVKASTKPQDIDAMTFRLSLTENDVLNSGEEILVLVQDKANSSLTLVPAVSSSQDNSFTMTVYDSEAKLDQPPEETNSASPTHSHSPEREQNQTEVKTIGWSDSLERPGSKSHIASSFEGEDDTETVYSEVSDVSSTVLQAIGGSGNAPSSSATGHHGQSPEEGREGYSGAYGSIRIRALEACSKLGEDLLRMFLEEISWDIIVQVDGREIKAHKCILVSRCKYFATMLNGDWSESSLNKINLQGFSYPVVHFALCHIYSGAINLPKDLAVPELALLADMLVLDTLKDVIVFYLKMNHCHFFHKPCNHCLVGVVECLPVAVQCSLKELHGKAVRWIGKHFIRVWPTKAFANLSDDLKEQCYQQTLLNMSVETVIDMTLNCDRLMSTIPHVKWAEPVFGLVTRLLEDCIHFMAGKFDQVLASDGFMALGKSQSWNVAALEDSVLSSVELVNPDSACRTFIQLNRLIPMTQGTESGLLHHSNISPIEHGEWTQNFLDLLLRIQRHCERYLIHNANKVVHCQSWALLAPEVQKKIKDAAVIVFEFEKPTAPPPRLTSLQRKQKNPEDKSLTFPRKAQVVRGKKTSKSFRERPTDGKETEVKRPLPVGADGSGASGKAMSQSNLSLQESVNARIALESKEPAIPRNARRRASEGYYKMDQLQRSYEEEDEDDDDNDNVIVSEQSGYVADDALQDDLPPPPDEGCLPPDEEFPSPPNEEQLSEEISAISQTSNICPETDVSNSVSSEPCASSQVVARDTSSNVSVASEPPAKPPRRSVIVDNGYDVLKDIKPVPVKDMSRSPKRDPPLPPAPAPTLNPPPPPPSSIPVPRSPTSSVRSVPARTTSSSSGQQEPIYSKPMGKGGIPKPRPPPTYQESAPPETAAADLDEDDDSSGYEKVWVGVTGAPYHFDEQISPTLSARTDLVAEIDEDTMLVNSCLHEAEALELAIAKKMQSKQHKLEKMINTSTYSVSHSHHHHSSSATASQSGETPPIAASPSPVAQKKKSSRSSAESSSKSVVSASTQIGSKNSLKRAEPAPPPKSKRSSSKSTPEVTAHAPATSSSSGNHHHHQHHQQHHHAMTPKTKVTPSTVTPQDGGAVSAQQTDIKSTKNSNSSMLPRSRVSSALAASGPTPGHHRDKSKSGAAKK